MTEKTNERKYAHGLLALALIFFANPNVHVIDVLPDFIGYLIIARSLSYAADRAPYFAEAKTNFSRLAVLSLAKIPAFLILSFVRSHNIGDNDILSLFAFSFAVIEIIFTVMAVKTLFTALFYLGERSNSSALLSPFKVSKSGKRSMTPEALRALLIIFSVYKCASYSLPEMLLLTRTVSAGNAATVFNVARLYPYVMVFALPTVLILGIITAMRAICYARAIEEEGLFKTSLDALIDEAGQESLSKKQRIRDMKSAITIFAVASVFTLELRFDNLYSINLLPRFIFGLVLLYGIYRLSKYTEGGKPAIICGAVYTAVAFAFAFVESSFLADYSYELLAGTSYVKSQYVSTIVLSAVELTALAALLIFSAVMLSKFVVTHTGVDKSSDRYMRTDAEYHAKTKRKVYIWVIIGVVSGATKLANTIFQYHSKNIQVAVGDGIEMTTEVVTESLIPWFGVVVFSAAVVFIAYSMYLFNSLKEDAELKYL